ncbi:hypothetical protein [Faecalicatena orotica]|uniref:hypothetical protein n=1 Tax=Faecalicatena orotica TaxID=1544 RepID=UPI0032180C08
MDIYDAKLDEQFKNGKIDVSEKRERILDDGAVIPYQYIHGYFEGTDVKFSFCFPEKEQYEERFYQYLSPFPGPDEELASLPVTGIDDKVAFCLVNGAYYVESNMGSKQMFVSSEDPTLSYRSSAATAEFSRLIAIEVYGYEHRPYGYVYGGSGGGYRTIACIENTNAFDGAAPYVIGSPYAIPNCQTTRALAERLLRNKIGQIIDAVDAGGSGNPYEGLDEVEAAALKEVTTFGYPLKSWFASADLNDGSLPVLLPGIKEIDTQYFTDFWTKEGYEGTDPREHALEYRIHLQVKVVTNSIMESENHPLNKVEMQDQIDTRNGVNDAWKKMISTEAAETEPWIAIEKSDGKEYTYFKGTRISILSGEAAGKLLQVKKMEGNRLYLEDGYGTDSITDTLAMLKIGDEILIDNSDYLAIQYYHRHQVPSSDYLAWDQFRNEDGTPGYPQRPMLAGPFISGNGTGSKQTGLTNGKIIVCASLMDEQAYPWQADWYRRKVASVHDGNDQDYMRLWYFDNTLHDDITASVDELHATSYLAGLKQALIDLAKWVEKGVEPLPSTQYQMEGGHVVIGETALERGGVQPVAKLTVNGEKCCRIKAGETLTLTATAEVPENAGALTYVEWSLEGEQDFPYQSEWELEKDGQKGISNIGHTYQKTGTYFAVVRVKSERNGDKTAPFTQIRNIDRVRIVVE